MTLDQRGDGGNQLRQRGSQRHKGQRDNALRHTQRLRNQGAVVHQQVGAQRDEHRAQHQQHQRFGEGHLLLGVLMGLGGGVFHLQHIDDHVSDKHRQHDDAHDAGKPAEHIGRRTVDGCRRKEKGDRRL